MRIVLQRVLRADVRVNGKVTGAIEDGIVVMLGVSADDTENEVRQMADKLINIRIFTDSDDKKNLSLRDISGGILLIPNFTLFADCSRGRRPYYSLGADHQKAEALYNCFSDYLRERGVNVQTGVFRQRMYINMECDGPVTIVLNSEDLKRK